MNRFPHTSNSAFTLIELIVYVAISIVVFIVVIGFGWNVIRSGISVDVSSELIDNGRTVFDRFTQEVRRANGVNIAQSIFDTNPGILQLANPGGTFIFDTYEKSVTVGSQPITIRKLRIRDLASSTVDLTSDRVHVEEIIFRERQRGSEPMNIKLELTLAFVNSGGDPLRTRTITLQTAVSLRNF